VIRAFNEEQHIGRLLDGIQQQTVKNVEIILVDSGSTDGTAVVVERYPIKQTNSVRIVHIRRGLHLWLLAQPGSGACQRRAGGHRQRPRLSDLS
jgi:glycosyltransferase involved in cell wall biosynthesis